MDGAKELEILIRLDNKSLSHVIIYHHLGVFEFSISRTIQIDRAYLYNYITSGVTHFLSNFEKWRQVENQKEERTKKGKLIEWINGQIHPCVELNIEYDTFTFSCLVYITSFFVESRTERLIKEN